MGICRTGFFDKQRGYRSWTGAGLFLMGWLGVLGLRRG